jgi:hypothetical protein
MLPRAYLSECLEARMVVVVVMMMIIVVAIIIITTTTIIRIHIFIHT